MSYLVFSAIAALLVLCVFGIDLLLYEVFDILVDPYPFIFSIIGIWMIVSGIWGICALIF